MKAQSAEKVILQFLCVLCGLFFSTDLFRFSRKNSDIAVVIPIEIWNKLLPKEDTGFDELSEALEDYCLDRAMDEGKKSPLLNRNDALKYLEG